MIDRLRGVSADEVAARWREQAADLAAGRLAAPSVPDLPPGELTRTPAAWRIGALAAEAGLQPMHFERRVHLPLPLAWTADGDPDQAAAPAWQDGVLPERKYQSFRHDLPLASHHPHHRAKWGAHELCHGLVGFAWSPAMAPFAHATAGRLAETLPVALWYGFDEAFLVRCPDHTGVGALFDLHCPACEAAAAATPHDPHAAERIAFGLRFVADELDAVARTREAGRVIPHRFATLDLSTDGIAYALAHGARLTSPAFHRFAEALLVDDGGAWPSLDALVARVVDVTLALVTDDDPPPLAPSTAHARARWIAQDLGWRVLTVEALDGAAGALSEGLDRLAAVVDASRDPGADPAASLRDALAWLTQAAEAPDAPPWTDAILQTGYDLPDVARAPQPLAEGLASALPVCLDGLEQGRDALLDAFTRDDGPARRPLADRFVAWLDATHPGPLADLARWEAAAVSLPGATRTLPGPALDDAVRLTPGWRVLRFGCDVLSLAESVASGALGFDGPALVVHAGDAPAAEPTALLLGRTPGDEAVVLDVDPATAEALLALPAQGGPLDVPADERAALLEHGALLPAGLAESVSHDPPDLR